MKSTRTRVMSRNEINPKTLIMDTQMTRLMMSGDYEKVNSKLEKYHVHSTKGLDILSMNQRYLLFRRKCIILCWQSWWIAVGWFPKMTRGGPGEFRASPECYCQALFHQRPTLLPSYVSILLTPCLVLFSIIFMDSLNLHESQRELMPFILNWIEYEHARMQKKSPLSLVKSPRTWHLTSKQWFLISSLTVPLCSPPLPCMSFFPISFHSEGTNGWHKLWDWG